MSARGTRVLHAIASALLVFAFHTAQAQKHGPAFPGIPSLNPGGSHKHGGLHPGNGFGQPLKDHAGIGSSGPGKGGPLDKGPDLGFPTDKGGVLDRGPGFALPTDRGGPLDKGPAIASPSDKGGPLDKGPGNSSPLDRGNPDKGPPSFVDRGPSDKSRGDVGSPGSDKGSSSFADRGSSDRGSSHSDKGSSDKGSDKGPYVADHGSSGRGDPGAERDASASGRGGSGGSSSDKDSPAAPGENLQTASSENALPKSRPLRVIPTCR